MTSKIRCPKCHSTQCYRRVKTEDYLCQKCGNVWKNGVKK